MGWDINITGYKPALQARTIRVRLFCVYTQAEPLLSWLEEPAVPVMFISHPKPLPLIREGLVASVPLASCALGIIGILCKIDAITQQEQTFGSLKRRLPTLLYMSLLLLRESLTALCNRGKSCKSSAE